MDLNKVKVEIPIKDGVVLVLDADRTLAKGFIHDGKFNYHCRQYNITVFCELIPGEQNETK